MDSSNKIDDMYKDLQDFKQIPFVNDYLISKFGLIYNKKTKKILTPSYHTSSKLYSVNLNTLPRQQQIKNLLYITFIDPNLDPELLTLKSKYCVHIKNTNEDLPFINFTIDDLEYKSKSDLLKEQKRNNRIINKYDLHKMFIKSYENIEEIREELNIKTNKYITLCASKKKDNYRDFIFRYDDIDEIKYIKDNKDNKDEENFEKEESKISLEDVENNLMIMEDINIENEIWKEIKHKLIINNEENSIIYEISNFGNFRSKKIIANKRSKLVGTYKVSILSQNIVCGYKQCNLTENKKQVIKLRTNVLVAKYFLIIPERLKHIPINKIVVDHKDHNKLNNNYRNLQYVTIKENNSNKFRN